MSSTTSNYTNKRETDEGNVVYEYSDDHIKKREKEKAEKAEKLRKSIDDLMDQVQDDLDSDDPKKEAVALAVALIGETYGRVGNRTSEKERGHYGITGWRKKHISFNGDKATVSYTGKSGVDQEKEITDKKIVNKLKDLAEDKNDDDPLLTYCPDDSQECRVSNQKVNDYLDDFDVTAKDFRSYYANKEMEKSLKEKRKEGPNLPDDDDEREDQLKEEFKDALEDVSDLLGHETSTLKNQYLAVGFRDHYLDKGKPLSKYDKKASRTKMAKRVASRVIQSNGASFQ